MTIVRPLPQYLAPEPTGDDLLDQMQELAAYRAWVAEVNNVQKGNMERIDALRLMCSIIVEAPLPA